MHLYILYTFFAFARTRMLKAKTIHFYCNVCYPSLDGTCCIFLQQRFTDYTQSVRYPVSDLESYFVYMVFFICLFFFYGILKTHTYTRKDVYNLYAYDVSYLSPYARQDCFFLKSKQENIYYLHSRFDGKIVYEILKVNNLCEMKETQIVFHFFMRNDIM